MQRLAVCVAALVLGRPVAAQVVVPESIAVRRPNPFAALGGRALVLGHVRPFPGGSTGSRRLSPGDSIGAIEPFPALPSARHAEALRRADSLYAGRQYAAAAAVLAAAYRDEPDNPFVLNAYARTLFWVRERRDESFELYQRLIGMLDRQWGTSDTTVAVDLWFLEAYWKTASLYLDRAEYEKAAFEITRVLASGAWRGTPTLGQAYDFMVEAAAHLGNDEVARWYAARALRANPADQYVLDLLHDMGRRATTREPTDVLACRSAQDSLPTIGAYSFYRDRRGFHCPVDWADNDGTGRPCLRIGWTYVGLARTNVERLLGTPWKSQRHEGDGHEIAIYLVFQDRQRHRGAYYAVEYEPAGDRQVAESVQLTGDPPPLPLDLSCLHLGDPAERVTRQLGRPDDSAAFNDESMHLKGSRWEYQDVPLSIEIVDGKVYSLKVWRPDALPPSERRLKLLDAALSPGDR